MRYKDSIRKCECGSENFTDLWEKKKWSKARLIKDSNNKFFHLKDVFCNECGVVMKNPMMDEASQHSFYSSGHYTNLYAPDEAHFISKTAINLNVLNAVYILNWLEEVGYQLKDKHVFEVGTGIGCLMKGMKGAGAIVDGIDVDKRRIEVADKLFGFKQFKCMPYQDMNDTIKYDLVVCCNTLEHFYSPYKVLGSFKKILKPGGMVLVEVPDAMYPYPMTLIDGFLSSAHNFTFTEEAIKVMCNKTEYKIEHISHAGHKKCMLMLLKPSEDKGKYILDVDSATLIDAILNRFRQVSEGAQFLNEKNKELFEGIYVDTIIKEIDEKFPDYSNLPRLSLAKACIENERPLDALKLLDRYREGQPEDTNLCRGTFTYFQATAYRLLGDFVLFRELLEKCTTEYPNLRKYNFVKDLEIDGLVSNSVYSSEFWWNAEKLLQNLG